MTGSKGNNQQENLNAGLWAAVSSLPQAKLVSLDDQLRLGREHAARHNCRIVAEFVVPGESRDIVLFEEAARRMDAYRQLGEAIEKKTIDILFYYDRSRLGRTAPLSLAVTELCRRAGILTYELESPPATLGQLRDGGQDALLMDVIKAAGAQWELKKNTTRQANGMIGRTQRGLMAGKPNFGYTIRYESEGAKARPIYEVDSEAAETVKEIFRLYLSGQGGQSIAWEMSQRGIASPSGRSAWSHAMIISLLDKVWRYAGFAELNRRSEKNRPYIRSQGQWPAIIPEDMAAAIVAERTARKQNRRLANTPYLLSGVCYCAVCGQPMPLSRQSPKDRRHYDVLRCYRHTPGTYIPYHRAVEVAYAAVAALADVDLTTFEKRPAPLGRLNRQEAAIEKQLEELAAAELRADDQYVAGRMTPERYQRQIDALAEKRAKLESDLAALQAERQRQGDRTEQRKRLQTAKEIGLEMLNNPEIPIARKNVFLRQIMIIWIEGNQVSQVDWKL